MRAILSGDAVTFEVSDSGIGMSRAQLATAFERFTQGDLTINRRFGGAGLGLAIARSLATMMGGELTAESTIGVGSRFTARLVLPLEASAVPAAQPTRTVSDASEAQISGLRVLAAEDHPMNRRVLAALLQGMGMRPDFAENGREACEMHRAEPYDLILMDMAMPVMGGQEAIRAIRSFEAETGATRTPILAVTASAMAHERDAYLAAGADDLVAKPIDPARLFETILAYAAKPARREVA